MSSFSDPASKGIIRFKSWPDTRTEVLRAIREIAQEPQVQNTFPTSLHIEGYPGAGITTSVFRATWKDAEEIVYRVRVYLDRYSSARAEVL